jgi:hypothetical protein
MTPAQKLARSRLAIVQYLDQREYRGEARRDGAWNGEDEGGPRSRTSGLIDGISAAARSWWRHHPAQLALEMATPALQSCMRRKPFQVLAISAGVGALVAVIRPWRLISLTTVALAVVKSSQLSGVVMSALAGAQGWDGQQPGRDPQR